MLNPRNKAQERQETNRLMDMTQDQLREVLHTVVRPRREDDKFTTDEAMRLLMSLDFISGCLRLCRTCLQRSPRSQTAKYCYVGTLRLVYTSPPTIRQLRLDAGIDKPAR